MSVSSESAVLRSNSVWIVPKRGTQALAGRSPSPRGRWQHRVLLVDDQCPFRERLAAGLRAVGVDALQASGVYCALRLARECEVDLLVISGDQRYESGWRCAGKLCGRPPWRGVILHFGHASVRDRLWCQISELAALVETKGQVQPLVDSVLQSLGGASCAAARAARRHSNACSPGV